MNSIVCAKCDNYAVEGYTLCWAHSDQAKKLAQKRKEA